MSWIGNIPSHWDIIPIRGLLRESDEKVDHDGETLLSLSQYTGIKRKDEVGKTGMFEAESTEGYKKVHPGQFVMNIMLAWNGSYAVSGEEGVISPAYCVFNFIRDCDRKYVDFLLRNTDYPGAFKTASRGIIESRLRLYPNKFYPFKVVLPPLSEQQHIVSFLDKKTSQIDEYIATKEKEIEALKEWKKALTAKLITQGLQADAEMKETGVFWWPHTPKHWRIVNMGRVLNKMSRGKEDGAELLVCTNKGTVTKRGDSKMGLVADSDDIYQGVKAGDLLIHGMDTWHGAIAVSNYDGMCTPVVHVCTSKENLHFVSYYMQVMAYSKIFKLISNGVRQNTSDFRSWDKVKKIPIMLPTREEQDAIVDTIIKATTKADKMIVELTYHVEYMKEYKQRLIADVVTGKINVQP